MINWWYVGLGIVILVSNIIAFIIGLKKKKKQEDEDSASSCFLFKGYKLPSIYPKLT